MLIAFTIYIVLGFFLAKSENDLTGFNFDSFIAIIRAPYRAAKELVTNI